MKISHKFIIKFHQLHLLDLKLHEDEDKSKQSWLLGVIHQVGIIWLCLKASVPFVTRSQAKPIVKNDTPDYIVIIMSVKKSSHNTF